jgi:hypothetical protein
MAHVAEQLEEAQQPQVEEAVQAESYEQPEPDQQQAGEAQGDHSQGDQSQGDDRPQGEDQPQGEGFVEETPMVGVMDPDAGERPSETPWEPGVEAAAVAVATEAPDSQAENQQNGQGESEQAGEPETVAAAEAHVVMPRSSGAGSWLRWPTSSVDRSDPGE